MEQLYERYHALFKSHPDPSVGSIPTFPPEYSLYTVHLGPDSARINKEVETIVHTMWGKLNEILAEGSQDQPEFMMRHPHFSEVNGLPDATGNRIILVGRDLGACVHRSFHFLVGRSKQSPLAIFLPLDAIGYLKLDMAKDDQTRVDLVAKIMGTYFETLVESRPKSGLFFDSQLFDATAAHPDSLLHFYSTTEKFLSSQNIYQGIFARGGLAPFHFH